MPALAALELCCLNVRKTRKSTQCSRALSPAERNYSITELETLAVVWALARYHPYLYGQSVTVVTDHAAVRAILYRDSQSIV